MGEFAPTEAEHILRAGLQMTVTADTEQTTARFYKACIGWIRYKPLLLYITQPDCYGGKIEDMRKKLKANLPKICTYFRQPDFMSENKPMPSHRAGLDLYA